MYYDFAAIEKKWQANWEKTKPYAAVTGDKRPKFYGLIEFPYPSGQGLHVGHARPFTAMDIICRKKRICCFLVFLILRELLDQLIVLCHVDAVIADDLASAL